MRSGTSSLAHYLRSHPSVFLPPQKEIHFFSFDEIYARGLDWYASQFAAGVGQPLVGEASPTYLVDPRAATRIVAVLPDVKLIAILRNPVDRAYSEYWMRRRWYSERRGFAQAIWDEWEERPVRLRYLRGGLYLHHLRRFCDNFPRESLMVMLFEDLVEDPVGSFQSLCRFLGIDPSIMPFNLGLPYNRAMGVRSRRIWFGLERWRHSSRLRRLVSMVDDRNLTGLVRYPPIPADHREALQYLYREPNRALAQWLGVDLSVWDPHLLPSAPLPEQSAATFAPG